MMVSSMPFDGKVWLFDCGEGTQIQLQRSSLRPGKITKIFITHLHGDHLYGLPGLLSSISAWMPCKDDAIEIYGPVGLRQYLYTCLMVSGCSLGYLLKIIELEPINEQFSDVDPHDYPRSFSSQSLLFSNEACSLIVRPDTDKIWHLIDDATVTVKASWIKHRIPCFGYVLHEKCRPGKLDMEKVLQLGISPGPILQKLKMGESITRPNGQIVESKNVVRPPRPGRKVVILGDTCDPYAISCIGFDATVLIHEATMENALRDKAIEFGHSTPDMAANFAKHIRAKSLILNHFSQKFSTTDDEIEQEDHSEASCKSVNILLNEAIAVLGNDCPVYCAKDLSEFVVTLEGKLMLEKQEPNASGKS